MEKDFIFRIGPVPASDETTNFFRVYPGKENHLVYEAPAPEAAIADILRDYAAPQLECEPDLAGVAGAFGICPGVVDDQRAHAIALAAYDIMDERLMGSVQREGLIFQFGRAAKEFWDAAPWHRQNAKRPIMVEVLGSVRITLVGVVLGPGGATHGLALYHDRATLDAAVAAMRDGDAASASRHDTLGVVFEAAPSFAVDAMRRAHGLERVPMPLVVTRGRKRPPTDGHVAMLGAALTAVACLKDGADVANGRVRVEDVEVVANASPEAP